MFAKIYRPAKSAMQSGRAKSDHWVLEFEPSTAPAADLLTGWISSADTSGQVRLHFETRDQAIAYARQHNIPHSAAEPRDPPARVVKAYADNFLYRRKEPWSH